MRAPHPSSNPHAMDARLHSLLALYGDPEAPATAAQGPDASSAEARAVREAKFVLDHRARTRPDAATLDAVFALAAGGALPAAPGLRRDRLPQPRARRPRRAFVLAAFASLCVAGVVAVGLQSTPQGTTLPVAGVTVTTAPRPALEPEPALEAAPVRPANLDAWDADARHLADVAAQTARLRARMDSLVWDTPAADLSLRPTGALSDVRSASSRRR